MQHTDFHSIYENLKKNEFIELYAAVKANNGRVQFENKSESWIECAPTVAVNLDNGPANVIVTEIIAKGKELVIKGFNIEDVDTDVLELNAEDIFPGQASNIIDKVPETNKVKNVTAFNDGPVNVTCYGKMKTFPSRHAAIDFFWDCIAGTEGAERERYLDILLRLRNGGSDASDM